MSLENKKASGKDCISERDRQGMLLEAMSKLDACQIIDVGALQPHVNPRRLELHAPSPSNSDAKTPGIHP